MTDWLDWMHAAKEQYLNMMVCTNAYQVMALDQTTNDTFDYATIDTSTL